MTGKRGAGSPLDEVAVARDDRLLDTLGTGGDLPAGDGLAAALAAWRSDLDLDPPDLVAVRDLRPVTSTHVAPTATASAAGSASANAAPPRPRPAPRRPTTSPTKLAGPAEPRPAPVRPPDAKPAPGRLPDAKPSPSRPAESKAPPSRPSESRTGPGKAPRGRSRSGRSGRPGAAPAGAKPGSRWRMYLAAAVLAVGAAGVGMAAADAGPDSPLWPITQVAYPDRVESAKARSAAEHALDDASRAAAEGRQDDALRLLDEAEQNTGKVRTPADAKRLRSAASKVRGLLSGTAPNGRTKRGASASPSAGQSPTSQPTKPAKPGRKSDGAESSSAPNSNGQGNGDQGNDDQGNSQRGQDQVDRGARGNILPFTPTPLASGLLDPKKRSN